MELRAIKKPLEVSIKLLSMTLFCFKGKTVQKKYKQISWEEICKSIGDTEGKGLALLYLGNVSDHIEVPHFHIAYNLLKDDEMFDAYWVKMASTAHLQIRVWFSKVAEILCPGEEHDPHLK